MEERLQKIMSRAGYGSRRANEELIEAGRVRVNGQTASLGMKADPETDTITVDGKVLPKNMPNLVYIALNKPRGVLSDEDPNDERTTVRDLVPVPGHLFAVGRLDYDSEGLMLLTNDGELANRLTHPRYEHEKEYRVQVGTRPDEAQLAAWRRGVVLEDGHKTGPAKVRVDSQSGDGAWLTVILKEGRKRQIRETGKQIGLPVLRIVRVRIGTLELGHLKLREWRNLTPGEVRALKKLSDRDKPQRVTQKPGERNRASRPPMSKSGDKPRYNRPSGPKPEEKPQKPRYDRPSAPISEDKPRGSRSPSSPSADRPRTGRPSASRPGNRPQGSHSGAPKPLRSSRTSVGSKPPKPSGSRPPRRKDQS